MKNMALIVDDDRTERRLVRTALKSEINLDSMETENGQEALDRLHEHRACKLIILDLDMPVLSGHETLQNIMQRYPHIPVIVLTGSKSMDDAVQALKNGAFDFLTKPVNLDRLRVSVRNALRLSTVSQELSSLKRQTKGNFTFSSLVGFNGGLSKSVRLAQKAAACNLPFLILGETGTGKELFARATHGESNRFDKPFIAVNCGAIPEKLVESTLFGHEKGAFTGAIEKSLGKFREADGGTLFLDEVGELPLEAQVKLLRVLQQKEIEPVGAGKSLPVDVRIISATNRDLANDVREGRFREDLYFRLNVLQVVLPPLRERREDIEQLVEHFKHNFSAANHGLHKNFSGDALRVLKDSDWAGNIRELEAIVNRSLAMSDTKIIEAGDLLFNPLNTSTSTHSMPASLIDTLNDHGDFKSFKELEGEIIQKALAHYNHNISKTARSIGIAKSTLYTKMELMADDKKA